MAQTHQWFCHDSLSRSGALRGAFFSLLDPGSASKEKEKKNSMEASNDKTQECQRDSSLELSSQIQAGKRNTGQGTQNLVRDAVYLFSTALFQVAQGGEFSHQVMLLEH